MHFAFARQHPAIWHSHKFCGFLPTVISKQQPAIPKPKIFTGFLAIPRSDALNG